jgi:hypothetical protein
VHAAAATRGRRSISKENRVWSSRSPFGGKTLAIIPHSHGSPCLAFLFFNHFLLLCKWHMDFCVSVSKVEGKKRLVVWEQNVTKSRERDVGFLLKLRSTALTG